MQSHRMAVGALNAVNYESRSLYHLISHCGFAARQAVDSVHENVGAVILAFQRLNSKGRDVLRPRGEFPGAISDMLEADRMIVAGRKRRAVHVDENMRSRALPPVHWDCGCKINFWTRQLSNSAT
jgi:hypothetical protein